MKSFEVLPQSEEVCTLCKLENVSTLLLIRAENYLVKNRGNTQQTLFKSFESLQNSKQKPILQILDQN